MFDVTSRPGNQNATCTPDLTALTGVVDRAITALADVDVDAVSDAELSAVMLSLRRQQSRLAAAVSGLTAGFDARRVWASDGSRSAIDWISARGRLPRSQVADEVRDARRLRTMATTRRAWGDGDLSPAHVRTLTGLAGHPRGGHQFPASEGLLVAEAGRQRFEDWKRLCGYWRDAADPDGPEQRRDRDQARRRVSIHSGLDGVGHLDGYLTPLAAATVGGALERIEQELFDTDWVAAKQVHGDATTPAHLARTAAQRRHDALVLMAERAMAAPAGAQRPAPLVNVLVDFPTLAGRVTELASGTIVAPGDIAELLGRDDTLIRRVVFDGPNRITDISTARTFRGVLRQVLDLVHRRCRHGTCTVPSHRCEGDHVVAWSDGGLTTQDNGRLACGLHNRWWYTHRHDPPDDPSADSPAPAGESPAPVTTESPPTGASRPPSARVRPRTRRVRGYVTVPDVPHLRYRPGGKPLDVYLGPEPAGEHQRRPLAAG